MGSGVIARLTRGLGAGLAAGIVWWLVEVVASWAFGGVMPRPAAAIILGADLALGAVGGVILALVTGASRPCALALGMTVVYGFLRVFEPTGFRAELLFAVLAPAAALLGVWIAGREQRGSLVFVHLVLITTVATVFGKAGVTEVQSYFAHTEPSGLTLVLLVVFLPLAGVLADRALSLVFARVGLRLGAVVAAGLLAVLLWGHPQSIAPLDAPVVLPPAPAGAPDVLLISLDTTRADHMSTYGYTRETSPNLSALARDGVNFTQARSPAQWTVPGHASMLTGMFPSRHGAHYAGAWTEGPQIYGRRRVFPLADDRLTLAEILRDRGWRTGAFVANFANLYRGFGMAQGFARYDDAPGVMPRPVPHAVRFIQGFDPPFLKRPFRSAEEINAAALAFVDEQPTRPVFLFLNYLEAHQWTMPPAPHDRWARELPDHSRLARKGLFTHVIPTRLTDAERAYLAAVYDGQIALMDAALGGLMAELRRRGRYENALIVVTADHGELLGEHEQVGHGGRTMYEGLLHIPLVVKFPGRDGHRAIVNDQVQLVDILPTVLGSLGLPVPPGVQGERLPRVTHEIVAEEHINPEFVKHFGAVYDRALRVLYDRPYKLMVTSRGEKYLFDLGRDPGETENLVSREPERMVELERRLEETMATMAGEKQAAIGSTSPRTVPD
jgi:arylsulfatase A-like enzyme